MNGHLSEEQIQQYALGAGEHDAHLTAHVNNCTACMQQVNEYRLLFTALDMQEQPAFGFKVADLVLPQLPPVKQKAKLAGANYLMLCICLVVLAGGAYLLNTYTSFAGVSDIVLYLVVTSVATLLVILYADMYLSFQKKIHQLDIH